MHTGNRGIIMNAIPGDLALQLCSEFRQDTRGKCYAFAWLQCWGCMRFSKGNPDKMCLGGRQCYNLFNKRYARQSGAGEAAEG